MQRLLTAPPHVRNCLKSRSVPARSGTTFRLAPQ